MSSTSARKLALELADRLQVIGPISVTSFFGGAGLVRNGVQFAFVTEDAVYLRVDALSRLDFEELGSAPFIYATRAKMVKVASYYELPKKIAEDDNALIRWAERACEAATEAKSSRKRKR